MNWTRTIGVLLAMCAPIAGSALALKVASHTTYEELPSHIRVIFPKAYTNKTRNPVSVQLHIHTPELGMKEHHLGVIIDNKAPFIVSRKLTASNNKTLMSFFIPFSLERGQHLIRLFKVDKEGVIRDKSIPIVARYFYFLDQDKMSPTRYHLEEPTLSVLSPYTTDHYAYGVAIPIDVHLHDHKKQLANPQVFVSVDNECIGVVCTNKVYKLEGLSTGVHDIMFVLYDGDQKCGSAPFSSCHRKVVVK